MLNTAITRGDGADHPVGRAHCSGKSGSASKRAFVSKNQGGREMSTRTISKIAATAAVVLALGVSRVALAQPTEAAVENAKTAKDHEAIAQSYDAEAKDLQAKATLHQNMAKHYGGPSYGKGSSQGSGAMEHHCKQIASTYEAAAKEAEAMAADHREMAKKAGK
jgi:hypothetical protein